MNKKLRIGGKGRGGLGNITRNSYYGIANYIKKSRNYIYTITGIFIISMLFGFFNVQYLGFLDSFLKELIEKTEGLAGIKLIVFIFLNNVESAFLGLFLGIFFGIFSLINALTNGIVLGYVLAKVYSLSEFAEFWRILPHGIFELPAIFISLGLGLKLGMFMFSKNPGKELKERLIEAAKAFVFIVVPLLIIAAIIEGLLITLLK